VEIPTPGKSNARRHLAVIDLTQRCKDREASDYNESGFTLIACRVVPLPIDQLPFRGRCVLVIDAVGVAREPDASACRLIFRPPFPVENQPECASTRFGRAG
jgi:hypothetical protein